MALFTPIVPGLDPRPCNTCARSYDNGGPRRVDATWVVSYVRTSLGICDEHLPKKVRRLLAEGEPVKFL